MVNTMLPKQVDPIRLAHNRQTLQGELKLSAMSRLVEDWLSDDHAGRVAVKLQFGRDEEGYVYIQGSIKAEFKVICQRCNMPMLLTLHIAVALSPVHSDEEAKLLPENYAPLVLAGDVLSIPTIIEDEILLSMPLVPKHAEDECGVKPSSLIEWEEKERKGNPFQVLKKLLRE